MSDEGMGTPREHYVREMNATREALAESRQLHAAALAIIAEMSANYAALKADNTEAAKLLAAAGGTVERLRAEMAGWENMVAVERNRTLEARFERDSYIADNTEKVAQLHAAEARRDEAVGLLDDAAARSYGVSCQMLTGQNPAEPCGWCLFWSKVRAFLATHPVPTPSAPPETKGTP
jgi:hypothetical protein